LDNFLKDFGDVGFMRIVYDNDGIETNRTIAILEHNVYLSLCKQGYGDSKIENGTRGQNRLFRVSPFYLNEKCLPGDGRTKNLFIPVPRNYAVNYDLVVSAVTDKLKHLSEWGIIDDDSWSINVPLKSREKGDVKGGCFISFNNDISVQNIAMVRILLTDTYWPPQNENEERPVFRCFWSRERKDKFPKENTPSGKKLYQMVKSRQDQPPRAKKSYVRSTKKSVEQCEQITVNPSIPTPINMFEDKRSFSFVVSGKKQPKSETLNPSTSANCSDASGDKRSFSLS
jgi:hypothetical protein